MSNRLFKPSKDDNDNIQRNNIRANSIASNLITSPGLSLGSGVTVKGIYTGSFTMTPNNGAAISTFVQQSQTISGLAVGDVVSVDVFGSPAAYVSFERAYISNTDTLTVVWRNLHHSTSVVDNWTNADTSIKTIRYLWFDLT